VKPCQKHDLTPSLVAPSRQGGVEPAKLVTAPRGSLTLRIRCLGRIRVLPSLRLTGAIRLLAPLVVLLVLLAVLRVHPVLIASRVLLSDLGILASFLPCHERLLWVRGNARTQ
jgi:hypothetical protein